ncbi:Pyruvate dehydrogenase protein X component, mitochondrial [Orchesella cincta]|uniref:Dihydrolipoamide acetyltransferase component of pyruvate dehydrogenase complex n=1 Tax=Orchesella cincta TaxID=48709 RepID=A0A1D2NDU1_ORCCI|nr:Pyruvate dehydrogenase protein X component, mitochondrial [Orchesella cincta]
MAGRLYRKQMSSAVQFFGRPTAPRCLSAIRLESAYSTPSLKRQSWISTVTCCSRGFQTTPALDDTHTVNMPSLSPTMTEGTIVKWMKKEGDAITAGDVLCEIQTDKAVVSMEHDDDGILAKILIPENTPDVKVGTLIALTVDEGDDWKSVEVPPDAGAAQAAASKSTESSSKPVTPAAPSSGSHGNDRLVGPAVKNYLRKYGLESSQVSASGPHGTVTKGDVLKHALANKIEPVSLSASPPAPSAVSVSKTAKPKSPTGAASFVDLEISNMRRTIAKRLLQSKSTIPHAYGTAQCNMKSLVAFRKSLTSVGLKVSVNDLLIKCVANALALNPAVNCVWEGSQLKQRGQVDISVAVATPNGLITPIVSNVGSKDVVSISSVVKTLAGKAKDGKLQPHEFMGGTFSISNLGMFGIHSFSAIINPPQCAILAVGGTSIELGENGQALSTAKLMLSYDASAIMEDEALKFLAVLRNEVENVNEISMGIFNIQSRAETMESEAVAAK